MANLKIGFIGCGSIARFKHFPGMIQQEGVDLCAFCDLIIQRAEEAARKYGTPDAKVYTDYRELLEDKSIYAIHVLTPNVSHSEITVAALEGEQNWREMMAALHTVGYNGSVSIENEDSMMTIKEGIEKAVALLKDCIPSTK